MKKVIITAVLLLTMAIGFAQKTPYNAHRQMTKNSEFGVWFISTNCEIKMQKPSVVAYAKTLREVKEMLAFYGLDFNQPYKDENILEYNGKVDDAKSMYYCLLMEQCEVSMYWGNDLVSIRFLANKETVAISTGTSKN